VPSELPPADFDTSALDFTPSEPIAEVDASTLDALSPLDADQPEVFDQDAPFEPNGTVDPDGTPEPMIVELDTATIEEESPPDEGELADVIEHRFDSVATADAIESDLQDLFSDEPDDDEDELEADDEPRAEVVQLHASPDEIPASIVGLDDAFEADSGTEPLREWVGVGEDEVPEDPWAYMRPDDSTPDGNGFWANRPKFFGGEERKRRRAARKTATTETVEVGGPVCPNCFETGQVDLDDPIGAKLHASCTACDHVWSVAYEADKRSA